MQTEKPRMNKSESKYYNTACLMDEAMILLLEKKEFEFITVKEICKKAGVNRSTFYLHYENTTDLLEESVKFVFDKFWNYMRTASAGENVDVSSCKAEGLYFVTPKYLMPYLTFIKENKLLYETAIKNNELFGFNAFYEKMFRNVFEPVMDRIGVCRAEQKFLISFYVNGITSVVIEWLKFDCKESVENVIKIIQKCVPVNVKGQ